MSYPAFLGKRQKEAKYHGGAGPHTPGSDPRGWDSEPIFLDPWAGDSAWPLAALFMASKWREKGKSPGQKPPQPHLPHKHKLYPSEQHQWMPSG